MAFRFPTDLFRADLFRAVLSWADLPLPGVPNRVRRLFRRHHGRALLIHAHLAQHGWRAVLRLALRKGLRRVGRRAAASPGYAAWVRRFDTLSAADRAAIAAGIRGMASPPLVTLVVWADGWGAEALRDALDSLDGQLYPHWELLLVTGGSAPVPIPDPARGSGRLRIVDPARGDLESLAGLAAGTLVGILAQPGRLAPHALYLMAREAAAGEPGAKPGDAGPALLTADGDVLDAGGRRDPCFRPGIDPDLALSTDCAGGFLVVRKDTLAAVAPDVPADRRDLGYALVLSVLDRAGPAAVRHLPHVLHHRIGPEAPGDGADGTASERRRAIAAAHLSRRGLAADAFPHPLIPGALRIRHRVPDPAPRVSVIVPTRDGLSLLRTCVEGVLERTGYPDLEVLILDNGSVEAETKDYFAEIGRDPRVRVLPYPHPFNFSAINNHGVAHASGEILVFLNNDIDVIEPGWLTEMAGHALRPEVGAVGAKLHYADGTIQHAGVVTGMHSVAGHAHKGAGRDEPGYGGLLQLTRRAGAVTAACMAMRKAVFLEAGGFDAAHLPVAYNDVDLCLRLREAGYAIVWTPFAALYHYESVTRGADTEPETIHRFVREVRHMHRRWGRTLAEDPFYNPNLTLTAEDFSPAFPPRAAKPWRR